MKLFLFLVLVAFANAKSALHLLGEEECTRGPGFWCQDYKSAKQCGSVKYCVENHWKKQVKGNLCDECKLVIKEVHSVLADNITEVEIIQALEGACSMLGAYATECKSLVDVYGKEVYNLVMKYTENSDLICKMLGLCSSVEKLQFVSMKKIEPAIMSTGSKHVQEPTSSALCIVCEFALTEIDRYLGNNATEEKIINTVEGICNYLPATIKTECDALISEYGHQIIDLLIKEIKPKEVCSLLQLCSSAVIKAEPKKIASSTTCDVCKFVATYADAFLKNKKTQAEIESEMKIVCSYLGQYKDMCIQYVDAYTPLIIQYLTSMTPEEVCKELALCTSKILAFPINMHIKSKNAGSLCNTCKIVVNYVDLALKNQKTQAEIVSLAEKLCSYLGTYKDECDSLVAAYVPEIINLLEKEFTPDLVCKTLKLCTSKAELKSSKPVKVKEVKGGIECEACKLIATYADKALKDKKTQTEIEAFVKEGCALLGSYKDECITMVDAYLPEVLTLLAQELSPDVICDMLKLCTSKAVLKSSKPVKVNSGASCELCKLVVSYADSMLNNATEAEITAEVEKLCSYFGSYSDECKSLVGLYLPKILELLKQDLKPAAVCKELGLCTAMNRLIGKVATLKGFKSGEFCSICKMLVAFVDNELKDSKTEAEITKEVEQICNYLQSYKAQCDSVVEAYLPLILKYLAQEMSPDDICKELTLCTAAQSTRMFFLKKSMPLQV